MPHWTLDAPTTLEFDGVAALRVRIISGSVAVLTTDDRPRLDVAGGEGQAPRGRPEGRGAGGRAPAGREAADDQPAS